MVTGCSDEGPGKPDRALANKRPAKVSLRKGLTAEGDERLESLLSSQGEAEVFARQLDKIATSGDYESVIILTHAMFELPWVDRLKSRFRRDMRMPVLAVEYRLDRLVQAPGHDGLSARYFRALVKGKGSVEDAKANLLQWTMDHRDLLEWDGESFRPKPGLNH